MSAAANAICVGTALVALVIYAVLIREAASISVDQAFSAAQIGVAIFYGLTIAAWAGIEAGMFYTRRKPPRHTFIKSVFHDNFSDDAGESGSKELVNEPDADDDASEKGGVAMAPPETVVCGVGASHLPALRAAAEFALIMGYVYLCDRTTLVPKGPKTVSRTMFWGLNGAVLLVAVATTRAAGSGGETVTKPLQRDQTEEWKGWMQLMFIFYHYFAEVEIYNAIRIYIAAYVWMTGFGNFSYYYIKADFTLPRFTQMMWRLNFFVFFVCVTMKNEYMLYYIAAMHTFFTWGVFFCCWLGSRYNRDTLACLAKIGAAAGVSVLLYDVQGVFHFVMAPTKALLGFHDPLHPEFTDELHEWFFRSRLDHLVWVVGMLCALSFPWYDRQLQRIEEMDPARRLAATAALVGATLGVLGWYYWTYFSLPKLQYNQVHPFTSWIPLVCYLVLRNATASLRANYMHLFTWCGKVSSRGQAPGGTAGAGGSGRGLCAHSAGMSFSACLSAASLPFSPPSPPARQVSHALLVRCPVPSYPSPSSPPPPPCPTAPCPAPASPPAPVR